MLVLSLIAGLSLIIACSSAHTIDADSTAVQSQPNDIDFRTATYPEISTDFVQRVIQGESVQKHLEAFKSAHPDTLDNALSTPAKRLTFWLNMYNGFTQYFLKIDPTLYKKNRGAFFSKNQIPIAGYEVSMEDIEHGVLRRGATIWSKGYIRIRAFRKEFIQKYVMDTVDYRIHFALNCGAKSCPPVVVYRSEQVDMQLDANSRYYLNKKVVYNEDQNVVKVPALMNWFSADFGGSDEEKRAILKEHGALPEDTDPVVKYLPYDWTMMVENYKSY